MAHYILFTGHMIDAADRKEPRFPAIKEIPVRAAIKQILLKVKRKYSHSLVGIAGAACGGDILFHELCSEIGIQSEIYLALPKGKFKQNSVSFSGKNWEARFDSLVKNQPVHILPKNVINSRSVWERANNWMLETALNKGGENMTLIALWDGRGGDGEGGTEHMVNVAKEKGANTIVIDITKL